MTTPNAATIVQQLSTPSAYEPEVVSRVEVIETHISWIFLTDQFAYKVKKPVQTPFLDYSTLDRRHQFCIDEFRLNQRYAPEIYLGVVAIVKGQSGLQVTDEIAADACEFAVKMRRFAADALLATKLDTNSVEAESIAALGARIATFHAAATQDNETDIGARSTPFGTPESVRRDALDNFDSMQASSFNDPVHSQQLEILRTWTEQFWTNHQHEFLRRKQLGFIRECHGDLHCGNIVDWRGELTPFDGIEFNPNFHWIDVLSDLAFLAMDLTARQHTEFSHLCVNAYLEQTGDYRSLGLLRWYFAYRALVRAKVAGLLMEQHRPNSKTCSDPPDDAFLAAQAERSKLIQLAVQYSAPEKRPQLWITHGLSGSGKSTQSLEVVKRAGAIRVRSDVERKRMFEQSTGMVDSIYSADASQQTYAQLLVLAESILTGGYSAIIDATFLKVEQRRPFAELAERLQIPFRILATSADIPTLENRIRARLATRQDPSDADIEVLHQQIASLEPLTQSELACVDNSFNAV